MKAWVLSLALMFLAISSKAMENCSYDSPQIGQVSVQANDASTALSKAIHRCFELQTENFKQKYHRDPSSDEQTDFIDYCANPDCGEI